MQFLYKERYLKRFDRFPRHEQALIHDTDQQIQAYYHTRQAAVGLRIKQLYARGPDEIFEARVSRSIRIVWATRGNVISFLLVGSHDEVKRYLRSLR